MNHPNNIQYQPNVQPPNFLSVQPPKQVHKCILIKSKRSEIFIPQKPPVQISSSSYLESISSQFLMQNLLECTTLNLATSFETNFVSLVIDPFHLFAEQFVVVSAKQGRQVTNMLFITKLEKAKMKKKTTFITHVLEFDLLSYRFYTQLLNF